MPHTYILECSDGTFYVSSTRNLEIRMDQVGSGGGCTMCGSERAIGMERAQVRRTISTVAARRAPGNGEHIALPGSEPSVA
ncbi:hypothetical protein VR010_08265 [Actinomycetaceae bacterium L2_0104]